MTDLEKRVEKYIDDNEDVVILLKKDMVDFIVNFAKAETALLSQHIIDLQKDKGNLTDKVRELEQQIEKMKQDLDKAIESANKQEQWEIYSVLNDIYNDNFEVITSVNN